jgi:NlpC/P60 family putative phage cell wall peptidase
MRTANPEEVVRRARDWIGTPYRHQASVRGVGADCLGLLRGLWREMVGPEPVAMPGYTPDWAEAGGQEVLLDAGRRWLIRRHGVEVVSGDVILFRMRDGGIAKHLGIAANIGEAASFIHAYSGHAVMESPLSEPWKRRIAARFAFPTGGE